MEERLKFKSNLLVDVSKYTSEGDESESILLLYVGGVADGIGTVIAFMMRWWRFWLSWYADPVEILYRVL